MPALLNDASQLKSDFIKQDFIKQGKQKDMEERQHLITSGGVTYHTVLSVNWKPGYYMQGIWISLKKVKGVFSKKA